jgi:cell wall-associated NlpC family hydrolase
MRRLIIVLSAVVFASFLVSFAALAAGAQTGTSDQYATEDPPPQESTTPVPEETSDASEPYHHQVVDTATEGRFTAPGWETRRGGEGAFGESYAVAPQPGKAGAARFKVSVPKDDAYSVYARWPVSPDNATAARVVVSTASGPQSDTVNQRLDAGFWVMIGAYEMEAGEQTISIQGGGEGRAVADAIMIVDDAIIAPNGDTASVVDPEALAPAEETATAASARSGDVSTTGGGSRIVRQARRHLGTPYGTARCRIKVAEDCSCHTKLVFRKFGWRLPDDPGGQWRKGRRVGSRRAGDLVFQDQNRNNKIEHDWSDHVSIWAGNGYIIHASNYFDKVVRSKMKYLPGDYHGARRLKPK